jgi:mediator of RNA polymerase II transcription subunit 30
MQGVRPGSYGGNTGQRMATPMAAGMASPQQQSVQQRQPFPQHGAMQNANPQQTPIPTPSTLSASLSTTNNVPNINQSMNQSNNMNTMATSVGSTAGVGNLPTSASPMASSNLQQTPPTVTNATHPQSTPASNNGAVTGQAAQQASAPNPINTATVCKIGQETVQEIVGRTQEVFSYLKSLQPPVGNADKDKLNLEKQQRLAEVLRGITHLFKRLTFCWNKAQEHGMGGMEYAQLENLIPLKDDHRPDGGMRLELEKKRGGDAYRQALEESNEFSQQLVLKNRQLKEVIDQIRNIIWEINTMLSMR